MCVCPFLFVRMYSIGSHLFHCKLRFLIHKAEYNRHILCNESQTQLASLLCGKRTFFEATLCVLFVPLSIWPRSNIYVSLLNSSPFFPSWFLLSQSLTTFALLYTSITACLSRSLSAFMSFSTPSLLPDLSSFHAALSAFLSSFMFSVINYNLGEV